MPIPSPAPQMTAAERASLHSGLVACALEAGAVIWRFFQGDCAVMTKADESPVTEADHAAEAIILRALAQLAPGVPVVAEEEVAAGRTPKVGDRFFLVDPLDGTKEFVRRGSDFTVNIGLIEAAAPTLGVVYAPGRARLFVGDAATGEAWSADAAPGGAPGERRPLRVRPRSERLTAVASKSHDTPATEAYLKALGVRDRVAVGSSLKFGLVAAGEADIYPRPSPTSEWDTAAGDAVLRAAGGMSFDIHGAPLPYGKPGFFNPGFLATTGFEAPPLSSVMPALDNDAA